MKFIIFIFLIFIFCSFLRAATTPFYQIEQQNQQSITLDFSFPEVEISRVAKNSPTALITIPGLLFNNLENEPLLPIFSTALAVPAGQLTWKIISSEKSVLANVQPAIYRSVTEQQIQPPMMALPAVYPETIVQLREAGIFRDYRMMGLTIYPLQLTPQGLQFYKKLKIKIQFPQTSRQLFAAVPAGESRIFKNLAANDLSLSNIPPAISNSLAGSYTQMQNQNYDQQIKLVVDQKGIYKVSGQDLISSGITIEDINPQTLRLTSQGNDIAIYVSGEQDLVFDPDDYFEFLGEANQKTFLEQYRDMYADPFADENVYWLSWGGTPGIRMVEESGAIINSSPGQYNLAQFYPYTVHLEKDSYFERFSFGNTGHYTHTRDAWFFDFGIQSISKKSYPLKLIYPDSASFTPVQVKLAFAGKSQTRHTLMAWLNQRLVGQTSGEWSGQSIFILDNSGNSTIRTIDLAHGSNNLEIQLPTLSPDGQSDWIMFNWADLTYDRQYKADQDYLEFSKPSPSVIYYPTNNLFQFELTNFTRPDIEIYKKGISKIVNYKLGVQGSGRNTRYRIIFQDNIYSDDIEYIALSSEAKLSPKRIEKDNPFDPENPSLTLKDPANSADYLIITHQKFYERALELRDLRRQRGLNSLVVSVQDIYDEFNYGIKSPLAIKKFLEYAFYNWDRTHRLKYVVLLGDANYNYKLSGTLKEDLLPTFFYQSYEFGAVATDLPYALIAGKDYLPDIFIGRIPTMTNGEVVNVINKIREYEESPVISAWRNQSLFISGNDRSTSEFTGLPDLPARPAFRTQNQRVIDMLLDKRFTSFKLNTIKDTSLTFDPNFGGTTDLIDYFDNGVNFANFFGHGGGGIWSDVQLMNLQDVERLNNKGKYPFITSMTCFTGAFDNPGTAGLAQRLLVVPDKGAIGILASSGLGWLANDYSMLWNVMRDLAEPDISVGEAVTLGKIDYFINSQYVISDTIVSGDKWGHNTLKYDMIHEYNLIGDPFIFMGRPLSNVQLRVDNELPLPGDTLQVEIEAPFNNAEGYLEFANAKNEIISREPLFYSGGPASQTVIIPEDFNRGAGYLRAYLTDNVNDASGYKQIGINYTVFDSVETIPAEPNAEDSVGITLLAREGIGISNVKIVAILPKGIIANDTVHIPMELVSGQRYQTVGKIPPTRSLATVYYYVYVTNSQGQRSRMNYSYKVQETRPDPFIYAGSLRLIGAETVKLGVTVGNQGEISAQNVAMKVFNGYQNYQSDLPFETQSVSVDGRDSVTVVFQFPFPLNISPYQLYAVLNPENQSPDFNRLNNIDSMSLAVNIYQLTPALGSTYQNTQNDTITIENHQRFWLGAGNISQPSAVGLQVLPISDDFSWGGQIPVPLAQASSPEMLSVKKYNTAAQLTSPYYLQLNYNADFLSSQGYQQESLRLYHWDERMRVWLQQEAVIDTLQSSISVWTLQDGFYAPFISSDNQAPQIKLTIDGQRISTNSLVAPNPVLNVIIEDESGVNINRDQIILSINEVQLPADKVFIPDSVQQSKVLGITAYPELSVGKHRLTIAVKDVNGNRTEAEYFLQVSSEFDLHVYGNFPNPFSDKTVFSYFISNVGQVIDALEIRIFTVSGRLIKRISNDENTSVPGNDPRLVGYNELMWDGTDEGGNEVANGVYFALFKARFEDKEKQQILKVAKLK
jgi:hypothetical protein